jgi:hypothetical protein
MLTYYFIFSFPVCNWNPQKPPKLFGLFSFGDFGILYMSAPLLDVWSHWPFQACSYFCAVRHVGILHFDCLKFVFPLWLLRVSFSLKLALFSPSFVFGVWGAFVFQTPFSVPSPLSRQAPLACFVIAIFSACYIICRRSFRWLCCFQPLEVFPLF